MIATDPGTITTIQRVGFTFREPSLFHLGVIESPELLGSSGMGSSLVLSCNIWSFIIEFDYSYRYLFEVCSELSDICFVIWLRYHSMLALHDRPVLAMVNISALELYQLLQYSYVCSSMMSVHLKGGNS